MPGIANDFQQAGLNVLSSINRIPMVGGSDATVSGNATITLLNAAILALPAQAGAGPDANRQLAKGLTLGVDAGLLDATHGVSTIAALAAQCRNRMDADISSGYTSSFLG